MTSVTDIRAVTAFNLTHASFYPRRFSGRTEKLRRFEVRRLLTTNSASALGSASAPLRQTDVWRQAVRLCIFMYQVCGTFTVFRRTCRPDRHPQILFIQIPPTFSKISIF